MCLVRWAGCVSIPGKECLCECVCVVCMYVCVCLCVCVCGFLLLLCLLRGLFLGLCIEHMPHVWFIFGLMLWSYATCSSLDSGVSSTYVPA